ncbi:hypothetical protein KIW84_057362 [Lathyrus oleraceus]|uniref:CCHC-type domain-containing protein n=1 Tax=Pisum sativum TaxID=3888 RepID=A0A9D4X3G1_PEA|nr:hypothetical protein KIW84_057362 [Pisum sativum]
MFQRPFQSSMVTTIIEAWSWRIFFDPRSTGLLSNWATASLRLNRLRRDFEVLEMKQGESINDYFGRVMTVANDMRNYGEDEAKDIDQLSVDALQSSLLVHEQKFKGEGGEEHALKVTHEGYGGRGRGKAAFRGGRGQGRGRGRLNWSKDTVECYKCHKFGHFQYECHTNCANLNESEEMMLMAYTDTLGGDRDDVWFIDSGGSNHMCGDSSLFCDLEKGFNKVVRLGNYASMNVVGKGNVRLTVKGVNHLVRDVYYIPEMMRI